MKRDLRENRTPGAILLNMLIAAVSLFVNGFGIYLTIQANIGAGPWDVLNIGLSRSLGILYGTASIAVSLSILLVDIMLREPIGIAMFIDAIVVLRAFLCTALASITHDSRSSDNDNTDDSNNDCHSIHALSPLAIFDHTIYADL